MPATYDSIATFTVTGSTTLLDFTSIPQTYTDLVLTVNMLSNSGLAGPRVQVNNDAGGNGIYSNTRMQGNGTSAATSSRTNIDDFSFDGAGGLNVRASTTIPVFGIMNFFNYTNTSTTKTILAMASGDMNGSGFVVTNCGLRRTTSAITSIQVRGQMGTGTTATLYGILRA